MSPPRLGLIVRLEHLGGLLDRRDRSTRVLDVAERANR
jgi:hypothetical protein